jgi:membrane protein involved in colicin uptake
MKPAGLPTLLAMSVVLAITAILVVPAEAKGRNANQRAAEQARKEKAREEKERAQRKKQRDELSAFIKPLDANKDGSLSKDEFLSGQTDKAAGVKKFDQHNKNGDRFLSKSEVQEMIGN